MIVTLITDSYLVQSPTCHSKSYTLLGSKINIKACYSVVLYS